MKDHSLREGGGNIVSICFQLCINIELKHFLTLLIRLKTNVFCQVTITIAWALYHGPLIGSFLSSFNWNYGSYKHDVDKNLFYRTIASATQVIDAPC